MIPNSYISLAQLLLTLIAVGFSLWLAQRGKAERDGADGQALATLTAQVKANTEAMAPFAGLAERVSTHGDEIDRLRDTAEQHGQRLARVEARCDSQHARHTLP